MLPDAKILVVDDEPFITKLITAILQKSGFTTAQAGDGQEALARLKPEPPDLVLLDIDMPRLDGYETLARIKGDPETARLPVVMLTGAQIGREARLKCLSLGADDFLTKPVDEEELLVRIRNHVRLRRLVEVEIEKERLMGALTMAQAASRDMKELLTNILDTAELMVFDRTSEMPKEKYYRQFREDIEAFIKLSERLSQLDY